MSSKDEKPGAFTRLIAGSPRILALVLNSSKSQHNVFDEEFARQFVSALAEAYTCARNGQCDLVVVCSAKRNSFVAGADIGSQLSITDKDRSGE